MLFKACPRCGGDLLSEPDLDRDRRGSPNLVCLQCGRCVSPGEREAMLARRDLEADGMNAGGTARRPAA
jgi:hypothetical protein